MTVDIPAVTVIGHGAADAVPDVMRVEIGVECSSDTVGGALADAGTAMAHLLSTLTDAAVPSRDLQTSQLSVQPRYGEYGPQGAPIVGYSSSHSMTVVLRDLDTAPSVLIAAAHAGGDAVRIQNVSFAVSDESALATAARDAAFADAVARGEQYAMLAGARLGKVRSITESIPSTPEHRPMLARAAMADAPPIQAGSTTIGASIAVVFELEY